MRKKIPFIVLGFMFLVFIFTIVLQLYFDSLPPSEEWYLDLEIKEAQEILKFQICLPTDIPENLIMNPLIQYRNESGKPGLGVETNISIFYSGIELDKNLFTLIEYYVPGNLGRESYIEKLNYRYYLHDLIVWNVGWEEVEGLIDEVESTYDRITKDNWLVYRSVNISQPENIKSTLIRWKIDDVMFVIYSYLPYEETIEIAFSIPNCNKIDIE